jgi:phosphate-selective porin OprO and OprP
MKTSQRFVLAAAMLLLALPSTLWGQQARTVSGTVTSDLDGRPVAEVAVRLRGSIQATATDASGAFRIQVPANSSEVLTFTHPDHDVKEVEIAGRSELSLVLVSRMRMNQYGVLVPRVPVQAEERGGFLVLEAPDQSYRFWFDMRVQIDGARFFGETLNPIGSGVAVRRARIAAKAQLTPNWYGEIDMDFADSRADLKDAYMMYTNGPFMWRVGNFKETFSMETNTTSRYLSFIERPINTRAFTPSRHLGTQVAYELPQFLLVGGLHFQDVGGWEEVQTRKDNNSAFGQNEGYSLTGKAVYAPAFNDDVRGLHFGVAGSYRTPKTTDRLDAKRFDVRTNTSINRRKYLDTDRINDVEYYTYRGAEAAAYWRSFRLQGEYNLADVHQKDDGVSAAFDGFYVMGSTLLFGGRHVYNRGEGEFTNPVRGRSWGDVELTARYAYLNLNDFDAGITGGAGSELTFGLNFLVNNNIKMMLNYGYNDHDRYANGRGRLFVGTDANGNPTANPQLVTEPKGKAGEDFHMLAVRFEVNF